MNKEFIDTSVHYHHYGNGEGRTMSSMHSLYTKYTIPKKPKGSTTQSAPAVLNENSTNASNTISNLNDNNKNVSDTEMIDVSGDKSKKKSKDKSSSSRKKKRNKKKDKERSSKSKTKRKKRKKKKRMFLFLIHPIQYTVTMLKYLFQKQMIIHLILINDIPTMMMMIITMMHRKRIIQIQIMLFLGNQIHHKQHNNNKQSHKIITIKTKLMHPVQNKIHHHLFLNEHEVNYPNQMK